MSKKELETLRRKANAFDALLKQFETEGENGEFAVTLRYDNYQDGAEIRDADGNILSVCFDVSTPEDEDITPEEQFLRACEWL